MSQEELRAQRKAEAVKAMREAIHIVIERIAMQFALSVSDTEDCIRWFNEHGIHK